MKPARAGSNTAAADTSHEHGAMAAIDAELVPSSVEATTAADIKAYASPSIHPVLSCVVSHCHVICDDALHELVPFIHSLVHGSARAQGGSGTGAQCTD